MLNGLARINIELTSKCGKTHLCQMCGHQKPELNPIKYEDMNFELLEKIAVQLPTNIVVSLHRDGEPTDYPRLGDALLLFKKQMVSIVTHGLNLAKKADQIIGNCMSLTVSAFHNDLDRDEQIESLRKFLDIKKDRAPMVNVKIVGQMPKEEELLYSNLPVRIIRRLMHVPEGDIRYVKRDPVIPENSICWDFLNNPSVDSLGGMHICNRMDGYNTSLLGNLNDHSLDELWNSPKRMDWLDAHKRGRRDQAAPLCRDCKFWGVPSQ